MSFINLAITLVKTPAVSFVIILISTIVGSLGGGGLDAFSLAYFNRDNPVFNEVIGNALLGGNRVKIRFCRRGFNRLWLNSRIW